MTDSDITTLMNKFRKSSAVRRTVELNQARNASRLFARIDIRTPEDYKRAGEIESFGRLIGLEYGVHMRAVKRDVPKFLDDFDRYQETKDVIAYTNMGLVYSMMKKMNFDTINDSNAESSATFALGNAVNRFNPWRGYKFSTYACNAIAKELIRSSQKQTRYNKMFPVDFDPNKERAIFENASDRRYGVTSEDITHILDNNLADLNDYEMRIIRMRYLSGDSRIVTLREIGEEIGYSKERVRQIQNNAFGKIREIIEKEVFSN